jgi:drug/metabolite transporter (DMT)-like permease
MTWGALFLGEPITGGMLGGFALILLALVLVNDYRRARRRPRRQTSTV